MKKLLSIILVLAMALSLVSTVSAAPVAEKYDATSIVNVTGKVDGNGAYVNLLLLDANEEIKHVQEVKPEIDGSYRAKFKFKDSTDGLTLAVKQDGADVTDSVISAVTESEAFSFTFGATTLKSNTMAVAEFENYFNIENKTYVLMIAFYDEAGKLISVKTTDKKNVEFNETKTDLTVDIPEGTDKIKTFIWDSIEKMIPLAKEKTTRPTKELNILTIGNSFTDDPTAYLKSIANADGITLNITKAGHGGSSIWQHWMYHKQDKGFYSTQTVEGDAMSPSNPDATGEWKKKLIEYIDPELNGGKYFDIITFQQVSGDSGKLKTYGFAEEDPEGVYDHCAENLAKLLRTYQPTAEIVLQETWAYEQGYSPLGSNYGVNDKASDLDAQNNMYNKIVYTVSTACERLAKITTEDGKPISLNGEPLRYIPTGDAFQNARKNPAFQTVRDANKFFTNSNGTKALDERKYVSLHRDGFHSSHLYGRYLGGLVWYGALTGNSPAANQYNHLYDMTDETGNTIRLYPDSELVPVIKQAAQDALDAYGRWN